MKDLADVQEMIKLKKLDEKFGEALHGYVRKKYFELHNAVQNANYLKEE